MSVCKERAWETLKKLSFERVAGTEEEKRAAEMILEEMQKAGVDACIEEFEIDMPEITEVSFAVTKPEYKEYHCIGIGKSGTTPDEGITAPFAYIENALEAYLIVSELWRLTYKIGHLSLKGKYKSAIKAFALSLFAPTTILSGLKKSCTAKPSLKNSGNEITSNSALGFVFLIRFSTISPVLTGTVDFIATTVYPLKYLASSSDACLI